MNRRAFLTGLLASSALAPVAAHALTPGDWVGIEGPAVNTSLWVVSWGEQTVYSPFEEMLLNTGVAPYFEKMIVAREGDYPVG